MASSIPWVSRLDDGAVSLVAGASKLVLRSDVPVHGKALRTVGSFSVAQGKPRTFELSYQISHQEEAPAADPFHLLAHTERFWREWSGRCATAGPYSDHVLRSLITLKALIFRPSGGIVAAATTSLPEQIGGSRNWDYRFCWVRDATLTLLALMGAGYFDEARAWRDWLIRAVAGSPNQLQIMYAVSGERRLTEWEVPWLCGYENSKPVRIGNAAHTQLQLDVYGELTDALYQARRGGLPENKRAWAIECALLAHLKDIWTEPDEGIWEVRGGRKQFTYSKIMAWVAFDRAIKSATEFGMHGPVEEWKAIRDAIHADVCRQGYDRDRASFVQAYGEPQLDASLLLVPAVGFLPPDDPRVISTVSAIERELVADGFVRRYDTAATRDGLPPGEGMFLACSFWLADAYDLIGRNTDAKALFERLLSLCNGVGLLSEEYDVGRRRLVGNFPQAFSHIALVNTAHNLTHRDKPSEKRAGKKALPSKGGERTPELREPSMPETTTDPAAPAAPRARQRPARRFPVVLEGQPALVTGANSGIGKAVALGLAASGADVVVKYIVNHAAAEEVAHQIEAGGRLRSRQTSAVKKRSKPCSRQPSITLEHSTSPSTTQVCSATRPCSI